jgi:exodeoxyribonuclease-3
MMLSVVSNLNKVSLYVAVICYYLIGFEAYAAANNDDKVMLRVMQYNIWGAGMNENKPVDDTVAVIRAVNADIVGMQETRAENPDCLPGIGDSAAKAIADALGFYYYDQTHVIGYNPETYAIFDNAIISRYPILNSTKEDIGVQIDVGAGRIVYVFNIHLPDYPYQPYQLMNITYGEAPFLITEEEAIDAANQAREKGMDRFYNDLNEVDKDDVVFIFGDFNEPSHLDWTEAAAEAGYHPIKVEYPTSKKLAENGFVDALRQVFPDEVKDPKFSWPTLLATDEPIKDRIDFIYVRGKDTEVIDAGIVGEDLSVADIVYEPWPSDHRAVVATVSMKGGVHNSDEESMMSMAKAEKKMSMKGGVHNSDEESMMSMAKAEKKIFTPEGKAKKAMPSSEAKASKMFKEKKE